MAGLTISPVVEAKNTFSYIVMQVIWCLKLCNMTKSGGRQSAAPNSGGLLLPRDLRPCRWAEKKSLDGPRVRGISPVGKEKVYGGKDLLKSQVFSSEWNTERVREDASGDSASVMCQWLYDNERIRVACRSIMWGRVGWPYSHSFNHVMSKATSALTNAITCLTDQYFCFCYCDTAVVFAMRSSALAGCWPGWCCCFDLCSRRGNQVDRLEQATDCWLCHVICYAVNAYTSSHGGVRTCV